MASPKMPWFPFYGRDFFNDEFVKTLTLRGVGIYLYLLYHQWEHGSIPSISECQQFPIIKSDTFDDFQFNNSSDYAKQETTLDCLQRIHSERFHESDQEKNRFINKRLEEIRVQHLQRDQINRERSRKGGLARSMLQASSKLAPSMLEASQSESESETESEEERKNKKEKKGSAEGEKSARSRRLSDEEFLQSLRTNPAYTHLNIDIELGKMDAWLTTRPGRQKTRKFIVNWLNKIDKPMGSEQPKPPPFPPATDPIARSLWRKAYGDPSQYGY